MSLKTRLEIIEQLHPEAVALSLMKLPPDLPDSPEMEELISSIKKYQRYDGSPLQSQILLETLGVSKEELLLARILDEINRYPDKDFIPILDILTDVQRCDINTKNINYIFDDIVRELVEVLEPNSKEYKRMAKLIEPYVYNRIRNCRNVTKKEMNKLKDMLTVHMNEYIDEPTTSFEKQVEELEKLKGFDESFVSPENIPLTERIYTLMEDVMTFVNNPIKTIREKKKEKELANLMNQVEKKLSDDKFVKTLYELRNDQGDYLGIPIAVVGTEGITGVRVQQFGEIKDIPIDNTDLFERALFSVYNE